MPSETNERPEVEMKNDPDLVAEKDDDAPPTKRERSAVVGTPVGLLIVGPNKAEK